MVARDKNRFNQILFVDSLPSGQQSNMAKRLFEDIQSYAVACAPSPAVKYVRATNGAALLACLAHARVLAAEEDVLPMLHIECHGSEDGLELADGSFVEWSGSRCARRRPVSSALGKKGSAVLY